MSDTAFISSPLVMKGCVCFDDIFLLVLHTICFPDFSMLPFWEEKAFFLSVGGEGLEEMMRFVVEVDTVANERLYQALSRCVVFFFHWLTAWSKRIGKA